MVAAVVLLAASAIVDADERLQGWIPDVLAIPEGAELVKDRAIGSTVRLLSIATDADTEVLLADWKKTLHANGYPTTSQGEGGPFKNSIEFFGPGIQNAKIFVAPKDQEGRSIIEFDPTLN